VRTGQHHRSRILRLRALTSFGGRFDGLIEPPLVVEGQRPGQIGPGSERKLGPAQDHEDREHRAQDDDGRSSAPARREEVIHQL
jgi:hypothetical protein